MNIALRTARAEDALPVRTLLDAALLDVGELDSRIEAGDVLVATTASRILGTIVLAPRPDGTRIVGIAVRRRRRADGIGTRLVEAAAERGRLVATFDDRVLPFYRSLGFEIEPTDEAARFRGVFDPAD